MAKNKMIFSRKKNSKLISVILPSRKRIDLLQKTLDSIDEVKFYHDVHLKDTTAMEKIGLWNLNYDTKDHHYTSPEFNSDLEKLKQYINEQLLSTTNE